MQDNKRYQLLDGRVNFRQSTLLKHSAVFFTKKGTLMEDPVQPVLDEAAFRFAARAHVCVCVCVLCVCACSLGQFFIPVFIYGLPCYAVALVPSQFFILPPLSLFSLNVALPSPSSTD